MPYLTELVLCLLAEGGVYGAPEDFYDLPGLHLGGVRGRGVAGGGVGVAGAGRQQAAPT